jgi:hypothetical protein
MGVAGDHIAVNVCRNEGVKRAGKIYNFSGAIGSAWDKDGERDLSYVVDLYCRKDWRNGHR